MDRARAQRPRRLGRRGGNLRAIPSLAALVAACSAITGDLNRVIAIEVDGPAQRYVEENDTLRLAARAIDAAGDTVSEAIVQWVLMDVDSGQVGFDLDSLTGLVTARSPGRGRVRARVEELYSDSITIDVSPAPDSIGPGADLRLVMGASDVVSPRLRVMVYDLTTHADSAVKLAGKLVSFELVDPPPASGFAQGLFVTQSDTIPGPDPHRTSVLTASSGEASVVVRRLAGFTLPDSAVVGAVAVTAIGDTVRGSPLRFTIIFDGG